MNPLPFIPAFLILPVLFSCTQKSHLEIATGKVTTIKLGNVVRIKEINVLTSTAVSYTHLDVYKRQGSFRCS